MISVPPVLSLVCISLSYLLQMVLEAQDCKLQMMRQTRETVREIVLTGRALA